MLHVGAKKSLYRVISGGRIGVNAIDPFWSEEKKPFALLTAGRRTNSTRPLLAVLSEKQIYTVLVKLYAYTIVPNVFV